MKDGWTRAAKLALAAAVLVAGCARAGSVVAVQEFQSRITLHAGGLVDVEETLTIPASTGSGRLVHLGIADRQDGVSNVTATVDGRPATAGGAPGQVGIKNSPALGVTWTLPGSSAPAVLGLRYKASGTVHVAGLRGTFAWRALPPGRTFGVQSARIVLTLPPGTTPLSDIRMDEPGWTVTRSPDGAVAEKTNIGADEPATIVVQFAIDAGSVARPVWQENLERGEQLIPAFVSGGLFILVCGVGALVMVRLQSPGWSPAERATARKGLRSGGLVIIAFGLIAALVVPWVFGHYGPAPMAIPISIIVVGMMLLVSGRWALTRGTRH